MAEVPAALAEAAALRLALRRRGAFVAVGRAAVSACEEASRSGSIALAPNGGKYKQRTPGAGAWTGTQSDVLFRTHNNWCSKKTLQQ